MYKRYLKPIIILPLKVSQNVNISFLKLYSICTMSIFYFTEISAGIGPFLCRPSVCLYHKMELFFHVISHSAKMLDPKEQWHKVREGAVMVYIRIKNKILNCECHFYTERFTMPFKIFLFITCLHIKNVFLFHDEV